MPALPPRKDVLPFTAPWPHRYPYPEDEPIEIVDGPDDTPLAVLLARAEERDLSHARDLPPDEARCPAVAPARPWEGLPKRRCRNPRAKGCAYCASHQRALEKS